MPKEITAKGRAALMQLKDFAKEHGLDIGRFEDRAKMYDGLRPDIQEELKASAKNHGWKLGDVVAAYVTLLIEHYKKVS